MLYDMNEKEWNKRHFSLLKDWQSSKKDQNCFILPNSYVMPWDTLVHRDILKNHSRKMTAVPLRLCVLDMSYCFSQLRIHCLSYRTVYTSHNIFSVYQITVCVNLLVFLDNKSDTHTDNDFWGTGSQPIPSVVFYLHWRVTCRLVFYCRIGLALRERKSY